MTQHKDTTQDEQLEWVDGRPDGTLIYYKGGKRHRIDGPAVVWANGYFEWWNNGVFTGNNQRCMWWE